MGRKLKIGGLLVVLGLGVVLGLKYLFPLLAPFLLGVFFACLIEPGVSFFERRFRMKRRMAVVISLLFLVLVTVALLFLTIAVSYQELQRLAGNIPAWAQRFAGFAADGLRVLEPVFPGIRNIFTRLYLNPEWITQILRSILMGVLNFLPRLPQMLFVVVFGAISAYFFSRDKHLFRKLIQSWIPLAWQNPVARMKAETWEGLGRFVRLEFGLVAMTIAMTMGSFSLLGIAGAGAYGLLAGILDLIPVLGPGLVYLPVGFSCWLMGNPVAAAGVLGSYFLVLLIRQAAEIRIIGANLQIHPLATLAVTYLGTKFFGMMGFFLGPIMVIALRGCYRSLLYHELTGEE